MGSSDIPDARDGLTRLERVILVTMYEARQKFGERRIPLPYLYGEVLERIDVSREDFERAVAHLARKT